VKDILSLLTPARRKVSTRCGYLSTGPPIDIGITGRHILHARMESRLQSQPEILKQYHGILNEYLELGYMELVTEKVAVLKSVYLASCCDSGIKQHYQVMRCF